MSAPFTTFFAQATNAVPTAPNGQPYDPNASGGSFSLLMFLPLVALFYFLLIRPQSQAKKKQEAVVKGIKTGDRVITTSGIHGVVTNVKDSTVLVKVADNVKLEIEKSHVDKVLTTDADKAVATK